ncbi:glycosyltransferase family 4 protein [Fulvivirga sediminis]|uniref:Glycosyltransferase family 4 protein n=1 Tax=Fulvivirga sediminis TaxID=2803949 RepID=A0A937FD63_9BACT|nr:glycosyltransferase family 4 protein [Fulvivirga sediminis]MBL3658594.1 glycosyltransferase family 4 protein [Fulvivirga sediminis]
MNILFLTYQGDIAGSTNSIIYLTQGLARKGHNIYVGCRKDSLIYNTLNQSKVHVIAMTFASKWDAENMRQIKDAVSKYSISIINAQSGKDRYTSILAKWKYQLPVKIVHTRRQVSKSLGGIQSLFYMRGADKIVAVSEGIKKSLLEKGIAEHKIEVIYNGTPPEKYANIDLLQVERLKDKFGIKSVDFVIGCVARIKEQGQLLRALADLDFRAKVIFVGIEETPEFRKLIQKFDLKHDIFFEGMVGQDHILAYYKIFDVKVLPSRMEGLSQALLEAMYLKVPVIATSLAGNLDLIRDRENGLLFQDNNIGELSSSLMAVYHDTELSEQLKVEGYKTAQEFSVNRTVLNFEDLFNNLLYSQTETITSAHLSAP